MKPKPYASFYKHSISLAEYNQGKAFGKCDFKGLSFLKNVIIRVVSPIKM